MDSMLRQAADRPVATIAGLVAMACFAAWPLFRARPAMLLAYIGDNLGFVVHYALLGQWTAGAMNVVMGVQAVLAVLSVRVPRLRWLSYALLPMPIVVGLMTWGGTPSLLAAAATLLSLLGRMQSGELALRILLLAATPVWAAHDLAVGSMPGLIADLLSLTIGVVMLQRCVTTAV